jgi:DNA segregation ATPase FtsK/SpoIIIE-like protein
MNERLRKFASLEVRDIGEYNVRARQKGIASMPHILFFMDDAQDLLTQEQEARQRLIRLLQRGAGAGIHALVALLLPCPGWLLEELVQNIPARACLRSPSPAASRSCLTARRLSA